MKLPGSDRGLFTIAIASARGGFVGLAAGSLATLIWTMASLALAIYGFGRSWPLAILLPSGAIFFIAIAWFHYLRGDGLGKKAEERPDGNPGGRTSPRLSSRTRRALLWAALELVVLSALLYSFVGIGRTY